ncbi:MAG TPA: methanogenesis marker 5 protein, partial [Methanomassiliicoccales archaeon]|nr:methanogenesis marker 5 protein [Methanomassiliicoccales archaeon]
MKVMIVPPNSLILFDLVERYGHEPLSLMGAIGDRVTNPEIESPPLNVTPEDVKAGLKYAGIEVPSGIRGRLAIWGPLVDKAEAAIIMEEAPFEFGCVGCHRTDEMLRYLIKKRKIPVLTVHYPTTEAEA